MSGLERMTTGSVVSALPYRVCDAVCSKTLRGLSQCFATFGTCVLVAERDLYSHGPANIKVVLNREVDELLRENKYRVVNLTLRLYSVHSVSV